MTRKFDPLDPDFESRVRVSFARQTIMATIGATIIQVLPGEVVIELPFRDDLCQQQGFIHAGVVTTIVDSACGYAAFSLMPANVEVLSVEYKVNFLAPAIGAKLIATGRVLKPGRVITVCQGDVVALNQGEEKLVATMLATLIRRELA